LIDVGHWIDFEGAGAFVEPAFVRDGGFDEVEFELVLRGEGGGAKMVEDGLVFAEARDFVVNILGIAHLKLAVVLMPAEADRGERAMGVVGLDEFRGKAIEAGVGGFAINIFGATGEKDEENESSCVNAHRGIEEGR
jgi:hypothetical protein